MADTPDQKIEDSPLGGSVTRDGVTVQVHIYRFAGTTDEWTLEVVDHEGGHTAWTGTFVNDEDAFEAFEHAIAKDGIHSFVEQPMEH
ncbi:hypothetical protein MKK70_13735 [Methylobacterium sp. E-041]|uniref:hypothetical protein n=1 Tax=Methylobacterium sp. E-041 TaxID=2836573 RepID=UPI001FBB8A16|nr:hypothetical protein [Methylobacterium sp. E-041]MCJ2106424.1 hypothetical protein [Methylobacterium sp. E-041]